MVVRLPYIGNVTPHDSPGQDLTESKAQKKTRLDWEERYRKSQEIIARSHNQSERRINEMRCAYFRRRYPDDWRERMAERGAD